MTGTEELIKDIEYEITQTRRELNKSRHQVERIKKQLRRAELNVIAKQNKILELQELPLKIRAEEEKRK